MTIAIAAFGPNAGQAVQRGVMAAEILTRGAIGGFAVISVLDAAGNHHQGTCQTGGVTALDGMAKLATAKCAAVISSGPDRPEPLSQFLAGESRVALVTGHRLPNRRGVEGLPVNVAALRRIRDGDDPAAAVQAQIRANPELDFGLAAVTWDGRVGFGNSRRVARRNDLGFASRTGNGRGFALLCNSIHAAPGISIGEAVGEIVWGCLSDTEASRFIAKLAGPVPVVPAREDRIELDDRNRVIRIGTAEPRVGSGDAMRTTVVYSRASVWRNDRNLGHCVSEVIARVADGQAVPESGCQSRFMVERANHDPA